MTNYPRRELPNVLKRIEQASAEYGLRVVNVFHAGDGNTPANSFRREQTR